MKSRFVEAMENSEKRDVIAFAAGVAKQRGCWLVCQSPWLKAHQGLDLVFSGSQDSKTTDNI